MAIALFYAIGTGIAALSPTLFGALIATHSRTNVNYGYLLGAGLMIGAGLVAVFLAVAAERKSLEDVARPLTVARARAQGLASCACSGKLTRCSMRCSRAGTTGSSGVAWRSRPRSCCHAYFG